MNTKLTLTVEQGIVEKAKKYAKTRNRSLSDLIENYLKMLTDKENEPSVEWDATIQSLRGSFKMPKDFDYKKELQTRRDEKYL